MGNFFGNLFYAFGLEKMLLKLLGRWLKSNGIKTTGSNYWAAYMVGSKIKTNGPKGQTGSNIIIH